jgi:hypothetical protein
MLGCEVAGVHELCAKCSCVSISTTGHNPRLYVNFAVIHQIAVHTADALVAVLAMHACTHYPQ